MSSQTVEQLEINNCCYCNCEINIHSQSCGYCSRQISLGLMDPIFYNNEEINNETNELSIKNQKMELETFRDNVKQNNKQD